MSSVTRVSAAATVLATMLAGSPISGVTAAPVTATTVHAVRPVDGSGALAAGFTIHRRYGDASCESGSPTVGKAYQCFTPRSPDAIYNACWVQADRHFVLCLVKPWEHRIVRLHVTRGFGDSSGFLTVKRPWGLRLANGNRCLVILGPVHVVHGHQVNYYCNHKVAIAGAINERHKVWTVNVFRKVNHRGRPTEFRRVGRQQVDVAWNGAPSLHD